MAKKINPTTVKTSSELPTFTQGELSSAPNGQEPNAPGKDMKFLNSGRQTTTMYINSSSESQPNNGVDSAFFAKAKDNRQYNDSGK